MISQANLKAEAEIVLAVPQQILYAAGAWRHRARRRGPLSSIAAVGNPLTIRCSDPASLADVPELKRILFDPQSHRVFMAAMEATWWLNEQLQAWLG